MHRDVISYADLTQYAEIGLIIFVAVFIMILLRAFFMKKERVEHMENLPLEDGQNTEPTVSNRDEMEQEATP